MGLFSRDIKTMHDLFAHKLEDICYAEMQLARALPQMADKASDPQLKQNLLLQRDQTRAQLRRLDHVFDALGINMKAIDCPAIDGIIEEAEDVAAEVSDQSVLDAALISAVQAAEHYEIARYGSLVAWARQLGRPDIAGLLQKTLDEEKVAEQMLNSLAMGKLNLCAAG
jgi:ferritin-like metal-binding protein YciE